MSSPVFTTDIYIIWFLIVNVFRQELLLRKSQNAIIELNISYKISINYCAIKTAISTFSEHIIIFRTLSIDIWQFKCQQTTNKKWRARFYWIYLQNYKTLKSKPVHFFTNFFGTNFRDQNTNNVNETTSFLLTSCQKILRILCVWTLKILYLNKWILIQ